MNKIKLVCLQMFLKQDGELKINMKFHKSIEKKDAIELLKMAIEDLKEVGSDEQGN